LPPPLNVTANVDGDTVEPRRELTPILETMEILVQAEKNLLRSILRVLQIAQQAKTSC
jgi:hypothetical protein